MISHLVENVRFADNTCLAVRLEADSSLVRGCQACKVGGSTHPWFPYAVGFLLLGSNNTVQDCDVSGVTSSTSAPHANVGVYLASGSGCLAVGNRLGSVQEGAYFDAPTAGKYRDNLCAASVSTPYTGGTDAGNN